MEDRVLGTTGLTVTSVGIGCVTFGREIDEATRFDVLDRAWHAESIYSTPPPPIRRERLKRCSAGGLLTEVSATGSSWRQR